MLLASHTGYYQPAGPLITAHHGHTHPPPLPVPAGKVVAVAAASLEASPSPTPPPPPTLLPPTITTHQPPPSSTGTAESSDNEVIITSASSGGGTEPVPVALPLPAHTYRYTNSGQYPPPPPPPPGYTYSAAAVAAAAAAYPASQYYHHAPPPPATYAQQQQQHFHHDICYPGTAGYAASYIHPKTYTTFRRYLPAPPPPAAAPQYYQTNAAELYPGPPPSNATSSQVVSAGPSGAGGGNSSSYQQQQPQQQQPPPSATLVESYVPPPAPVPPTIVEPYPPPPPPHYYTGYSTGPAPPPACYTHSPPTRNLAFIAYQSCPCPMQSCPKNVHTGPLTGDGKRSSVIAKESSGVPLPPVALALPLEPASVAGPPSPARGSAGMPPPPSPAGATYQPTPITHNNNNNNSTSSSNSNNSSSTIGVPPILTPKWEDDQVLLMEKPTSTECTTTATTQVLLTSSSSTSSSTSTTDKRNKMARVGKQMARNNIMLLMCHNTPANSGENPVKREVESPEEIKTLVQSIAVPSTPPPTPTPSPMLLVSETKRESPESITELAEKLLKAEQQPQEVKQSLKNETYYAEELQQCVPQMRVMRRHSTQQQRQQHQQCKVVNNTSRRKSLQTHDVPELKHEEANAERAGVKRKLTDTTLTTTAGTNTDADADPDECKTQPIKKQKPNTKSKSAVAAVNGSYKDLIKRDKCAKVADVKPPERKFLLYKTPKIMLGRAKKTAKRKTTTANKDEPVSKRLKTSSRPLVASNLHNSKQNKQPPVQSCATVLTEKKPCQKRAQVNFKVHRGSISNTNTTTTSSSSSSSIVLTNVDRTIESVVTQCSTSSCDEHTTQVVLRTNNSAATGAGGSVVQARGVGSGRSGASKRKNKSSTIDTAVAADLVAAPAACIVPRVPRKSLHMPRWSNGWSWDGVPFQGKVFLNSDEALVVRRCYPAMRHTEGDIISPRDCVLLKAGPRKIDLPFVAKVAALWEDEDGEMMMSLLWYYRPEHTDQGRRPVDRPDEVFASRHKDTNSVACIEDKCYVLTFNEYCRYRKSVRRLEEGLEHTGQVVPMPEGGTYHRQHRQPPAPLHTAPELVFFCRQVYDFRQKRLMKNPS